MSAYGVGGAAGAARGAIIPLTQKQVCRFVGFQGDYNSLPLFVRNILEKSGRLYFNAQRSTMESENLRSYVNISVGSVSQFRLGIGIDCEKDFTALIESVQRQYFSVMKRLFEKYGSREMFGLEQFEGSSDLEDRKAIANLLIGFVPEERMIEMAKEGVLSGSVEVFEAIESSIGETEIFREFLGAPVSTWEPSSVALIASLKEMGNLFKREVEQPLLREILNGVALQENHSEVVIQLRRQGVQVDRGILLEALMKSATTGNLDAMREFFLFPEMRDISAEELGNVLLNVFRSWNRPDLMIIELLRSIPISESITAEVLGEALRALSESLFFTDDVEDAFAVPLIVAFYSAFPNAKDVSKESLAAICAALTKRDLVRACKELERFSHFEEVTIRDVRIAGKGFLHRRRAEPEDE